MKFLYYNIYLVKSWFIKDLMIKDGAELTTIQLDEGGTIPPLSSFDGMFCMGGPMDTWWKIISLVD